MTSRRCLGLAVRASISCHQYHRYVWVVAMIQIQLHLLVRALYRCPNIVPCLGGPG